jgi:hypothetical protein
MIQARRTWRETRTGYAHVDGCMERDDVCTFRFKNCMVSFIKGVWQIDVMA